MHVEPLSPDSVIFGCPEVHVAEPVAIAEVHRLARNCPILRELGMHMTQVATTGSMVAEWTITRRLFKSSRAGFLTEEGCREYLFRLR